MAIMMFSSERMTSPVATNPETNIYDTHIQRDFNHVYSFSFQELIGPCVGVLQFNGIDGFIEILDMDVNGNPTKFVVN